MTQKTVIVKGQSDACPALYGGWLYALLAVGAPVFCWFLVPETKGKSLEQIEKYWER